MPLYLFECPTCELRFERNVRMGVETHSCPECEKAVPRTYEGQTFGHSFPEGDGNTGVHDQDYPTADKAVGRDADKKWEVYDRQKRVKEQARQENQTHALSRKYVGKDQVEYIPMAAPAFDARKKMGKDLIARYDAQRKEKSGQ